MEKSKVSGSEIAIIGMDGLFPNSRDLQHWWEQLRTGTELISTFSEEELLAGGVDPASLSDPKFVPRGGPLKQDPALFDAAFFGFNPREAEVMDPQHRIFMEYCYRAMESSGHGPGTTAGRVGVFAGQAFGIYLVANILTHPSLLDSLGYLQVITANEKDSLPTQTSYKLNLTGPSVNVQTACSTSLVAVHMACQSLLTGECDFALAGGVALHIPQACGYRFTDGGIASPDGHCRTFDAKAQGTIFSSGVGVVVLRRLAEALADGDPILAVVLGSAINNDGSLKVGFTAPSLEGQAEVIAEAQAIAGVTADSISYVEAHGTATNLGDPIEIAALTQAFRTTTEKKGFCAIGSVKTNMGHLDTVAGVAGLMKAVLQLKNKEIVPSINFESPNPNIDFANSPFYVNTKLQPWQRNGAPLRAGVSSFGIGGTNAHLVLEEAPDPDESSASSRKAQLLLLTAKTASALDAAARDLENYLIDSPSTDLADVAFTLRSGRAPLQHRRVILCASRQGAIQALHYPDPQHSFSSTMVSEKRQVAFLFPGQGSQHVGMLAGLYESEPVFREHLIECAGYFQPHLGRDLLGLLYPAPSARDEAENLLTQTSFTQPALFAVEYALARLWQSWGIEPDAMLGHSIGEYVAACLAGVMSVKDACSLVAVRGRLMQSMPSGSMLSVPVSEAEALALAGGRLELAAVNAPKLCVLSGPSEIVATVEAELTAKQLPVRTLHTSHAFHSKMMEPILAAFRAEVAKVRLSAPSLRYLSNVSGTWITADQATSPDYWTTHLRQTVRFSAGLKELLKNPETILLEVGPGQTLSSLAKQHTTPSSGSVIVASARHVQESRSDADALLAAVARLWVAGKALDWKAFDKGERRLRVPLPTYPFERQRYWIDPAPPSANSRAAAPGRYKNPEDWFYAFSWRRSFTPIGSPDPATWLVLADDGDCSDAILKELTGHEVIRVRRGTTFVEHSLREFTLSPTSREDHLRLFKELSESGKNPSVILHLWTLTSEGDAPSMDEMHERGFLSLLALAQALSEKTEQSQVRVGVVTNRASEVLEGDPVVASKATILGPCTVMSQENFNVSCRLIDVQDTTSPSSIVREMTADTDDTVVAYRGAHRWVRTFEPVKVPSAAESRIREGGVYWITGGLGGIGVVLAEHIAAEKRVKIVLSGRSSIPGRDQWDGWLEQHSEDDRISRAIRVVRRIESNGSEVMLLEADATDEASMRKAFERIVQKFGALHGVIHASGVAGAGLIQLKTPKTADRVMRAKVQGTEILAPPRRRSAT
jgi:acyl transferase domain-containing protein